MKFLHFLVRAFKRLFLVRALLEKKSIFFSHQYITILHQSKALVKLIKNMLFQIFLYSRTSIIRTLLDAPILDTDYFLRLIE
jgi:hypothetical protein